MSATNESTSVLLGPSTIGAPSTVDSTGLTTTVPLTIKNGKSQSGVELWYTGTVATGYDLMNASGVLKGGLAIAAAVNDWITGTAADDILIHGGATKKFYLGATGGAAPMVTLDLSNGLLGVGAAPAASTRFYVEDAGTTNNTARFRTTGVSGSTYVQIQNSSNTGIEIQVGGASQAGTLFGVNLATGSFLRATSGPLVIGTTGASDFVLGVHAVEAARFVSDVGLKMTSARFSQAKGANVTAAATLTLGVDGNFFTITGNTNIDFITTTNWPTGSEITLQFTGTPTVNNNTGSPPGGTASVLLAGAANFALTANDILTLIYNGTNWCETGRTVI